MIRFENVFNIVPVVLSFLPDIRSFQAIVAKNSIFQKLYKVPLHFVSTSICIFFFYVPAMVPTVRCSN